MEGFVITKGLEQQGALDTDVQDTKLNEIATALNSSSIN
jgi:hypothetical protein